VISLFLASAFAADRAAPPAVVPPAPLAQPAPEVHQVGQTEVRFVPLPGARKVALTVILERGSLDLDGWPRPEGEALGDLLPVATETWDAPAMAELTSLHDVDVSSWVSYRYSGVRLSVPREELDQGLAVATEVLRSPALPKKDIALERRDTLRWLEHDAKLDPDAVADGALAYAWFPADHPFGARPDPKAWKKLKRGALASRHERLLAEAPTTVVVTGDLSWAELEPKLTALLGGVGVSGDAEPAPAFTPPSATRVVAVDMAGAEQTAIRLRVAAPLRGDADRETMSVVDFAVGGSFLSRLNSDLREEKGLTYGVHAGYTTEDTRAHWSVRVDVQGKDTGLALSTIAGHLDAVAKEGLRADEVAAARNSLLGGWNTALLTADTANAFYLRRFYEKESVEQGLERMRKYDAVTPEETRRVAEKWLGPSAPRTWVVVGDRATLEPQLQALGWTVEWITPEQAILGTF
jgi:zinc protease